MPPSRGTRLFRHCCDGVSAVTGRGAVAPSSRCRRHPVAAGLLADLAARPRGTGTRPGAAGVLAAVGRCPGRYPGRYGLAVRWLQRRSGKPRSPFCSGACKQQATFVRQFRRYELAGWQSADGPDAARMAMIALMRFVAAGITYQEFRARQDLAPVIGEDSGWPSWTATAISAPCRVAARLQLRLITRPGQRAQVRSGRIAVAVPYASSGKDCGKLRRSKLSGTSRRRSAPGCRRYPSWRCSASVTRACRNQCATGQARSRCRSVIALTGTAWRTWMKSRRVTA